MPLTSRVFIDDTKLELLIALAQKAGRAIMEIYRSEAFEVFEKLDLSPVTEADLAAHHILFNGLSRITPDIAVISEESEANRSERRQTYWLIDPLDGTKDFVARRDTFVVCLGLIDGEHPVAGIIHEPVTGKTWWARQGAGAFADGRLITNESKRTSLIAAGSRSTPSERMEKIYQEFSIGEVRRYGSALKFCHLAEGDVDVYPRLGPTCEWDTAAGQAIAEEAGCKVVSVKTGQRLCYGKPGLLNDGGFIASRTDLSIAENLPARLGLKS